MWTALKFKHLFELFYIKKEMKLLIQDFFKRILTVYTRIEKIFMFAHIYTIKDDNTWFGLNSQWNSIYIKIVIFNYQFLSNRRNLRKKVNTTIDLSRFYACAILFLVDNWKEEYIITTQTRWLKITTMLKKKRFLLQTLWYSNIVTIKAVNKLLCSKRSEDVHCDVKNKLQV